MSRNYDNWERLVKAVLDREKLRQLAREPSFDSTISDSSSRFSFNSTHEGYGPEAPSFPSKTSSSRSALEQLNDRHTRLRNIPMNIHGEQVAAGWPSWLSAVAGEAINGWTPRRADSFEKLDKIGQGTFSNVYKGRDVITGKIVALKKVIFDFMEPESVRFMAWEILVLRRLDHPNVVKLQGLVTSRMSSSLYLVFDYMDYDLARLASGPGIKFTEPQVKSYMHQLLSGLEHCHNRHVLHRDIKSSDLLIDDGGVLKIADFGSASFFDPNNKHPMTSRVVTLWWHSDNLLYRSPELLLGATQYGVGVDLWSAGCILAELFAGKPIITGRSEEEQVHRIFKLCGSPSEEYWKKLKLPHATISKPRQPLERCIRETIKYFPQSSLSLIDTLLAIDPSERQTATAALKSEFFTTMPYACDPSKSFSFDELKIATTNFPSEHLIGQGRFCDVFQGRIDEHTLTETRNFKAADNLLGKGGLGSTVSRLPVAVKKFKPKLFKDHKECMRQVNYLRQLHHPNLVNFIGYCSEDNNQVLVYEFMPKGSLERHWLLNLTLSWDKRVDIAIGVARALSFLHDTKLKVHGDVKSSSILLDVDFSAKLSGFFLPNFDISDAERLSLRATLHPDLFAYLYPDILSTASDVYRFGIILLELLCGRLSVDPTRIDGERNLVEWARPYLVSNQTLFVIMDPKLDYLYPKKGAYIVATLAYNCLSSAQKLRPRMAQVLAALENIKLSSEN